MFYLGGSTDHEGFINNASEAKREIYEISRLSTSPITSKNSTRTCLSPVFQAGTVQRPLAEVRTEKKPADKRGKLAVALIRLIPFSRCLKKLGYDFK